MTEKFDYARARATAERLIARFGQDGHLRVRTPGTPGSGDPWNPGSETGSTTTDHPVKLVLADYTQRERDGSMVQATDKRAYVSAEGLEDVDPKAADELVIGGRSHAIVNMMPLSPGGVDVLYEAQVRT